MSETIIIALISLLGTLGGTFGGILKLEDNDKLLEEKIKVANHRIDDLEAKR